MYNTACMLRQGSRTRIDINKPNMSNMADKWRRRTEWTCTFTLWQQMVLMEQQKCSCFPCNHINKRVMSLWPCPKWHTSYAHLWSICSFDAHFCWARTNV